MASLTNIQKIRIAEIAMYLAANGQAKQQALRGGSLGGAFKGNLALQIYIEYRAIKAAYDGDSTLSTMTASCDYLQAICAGYFAPAQYIYNTASGGGSVSPVTPATSSIYPFIITQDNFTWNGSNLVYENENIDGDNLTIFVNEFSQQFLEPPQYFTYVSGGGIALNSSLFPEGTTPLTILVQKLNS